jgi:Protein of unknown function (DUF995)
VAGSPSNRDSGRLLNQEESFMSKLTCLTFCSCALVSMLANAQAPAVLRDLDAQGRATLTKEELTQLLPNAKMLRVSPQGQTQIWKNDPSGRFIVSSDNRTTAGQNTTAPGTWHISDDGRYCVLIEWKTYGAEEWCRYIVKAGSDYYSTKSDKTLTERVYRLEISK